MRVQIYVQKKEEDREFHLAADVDPSMFGLQETLSEIVAKATFHEWSQVAMKFVYPEKKSLVDVLYPEEARELVEEMKGKKLDEFGIPADSAHDMGKTQEEKNEPVHD